jgi:hypothetical protein
MEATTQRLETIRSFFTQHETESTYQPDRQILLVNCNLAMFDASIFIDTEDEPCQIGIRLLVSLRVPPEARRTVTEFFNRANFNYNVHTCCLCMETGRVLFRTVLTQPSGEIAPELLEITLKHLFRYIDAMSPLLLEVTTQRLHPSSAVEQFEAALAALDASSEDQSSPPTN